MKTDGAYFNQQASEPLDNIGQSFDISIEHADLGGYDTAQLPLTIEGNAYLNGARFSKRETDSLIQQKVDPVLKIMEKPDVWYLPSTFNEVWSVLERPLVKGVRFKVIRFTTGDNTIDQSNQVLLQQPDYVKKYWMGA